MATLFAWIALEGACSSIWAQSTDNAEQDANRAAQQSSDSAKAINDAAAQESKPAGSMKRSLPQPVIDDEAVAREQAKLEAELQEYKKELRKIADRYAAPPKTQQLSPLPDLWIDRESKRVYIDGYVTMRRGPLEMFACPIGSKEHESIVAVFAKSSEVHAALLAIGTQQGTPVRWDPDFLPPTGQEILVYATWRDERGAFQVRDARQWIQNTETNEPMEPTWVFAGSSFWKDPEDGTQYYTADGGDMICVSNFSTAMMDVPFSSSADAGNLLFSPITDRIPPENTPVRLVLVPQPIPTDDVNSDAFQDRMKQAQSAPIDAILPRP
ncbi:MAG: YdjY domain-containing protein [Planctomycetota bacterium]